MSHGNVLLIRGQTTHLAINKYLPKNKTKRYSQQPTRIPIQTEPKYPDNKKKRKKTTKNKEVKENKPIKKNTRRAQNEGIHTHTSAVLVSMAPRTEVSRTGN